MATPTIEQYTPKTAAYINWVYANDSAERGAHHNYVAEREICNLATCLVDQSDDQLAQTDNSLFKQLHDLDKNPACFFIVKIEEFDELSELVNLTNNAVASCDDLFLNGFQVDIDVTVANENGGTKDFRVVFQNEERNNGMCGYSSHGMTSAGKYGCDADESGALYWWLEESGDCDFYDKVIDHCQARADKLAERQYNYLFLQYNYLLLHSSANE